MHFLLRRAAYGLFLLFAVSVLSFCFLRMAPGDYFDTLRMNPRVSRETVDTLRNHSERGRSPVQSYGRWLLSIAQGDWGFSLAYNTPASVIIWPRAANTLVLTCTATLLAWLFALVFGISGAALRRSSFDLPFGFILALLLSTPDILVALLMLLVAVRSGYLPVGGLSSESGSLGLFSLTKDFGLHLYLPVVCLAVSSAPVLIAHVRSSMFEASNLPFSQAARLNGIPPVRLWLRHILPVAANPLISLLGLSIGGLLSSSLVVEVIFSWPGLGKLLLDAILQRDLYLVADAAMLSSCFLLTGNFLADVLLYLNDPRIRVT